MGFEEEYFKLRKKRKESEGQDKSITDGMLYRNKTATADDIAPVATTTRAETTKSESKRTWFQGGAFEDGYQFGDLTKTILGTSKDLSENVSAGILGIGEKVVDAGAYLVGGAAGMFGNDKLKDTMGEFIKKDLYDEKELAKKLDKAVNPLSDLIAKKILGVDAENDSVFGEKTDSLAQSAGQLVGTIVLQAAGVPWFVTSGVTSFGSAAEGAFNEGATYGEAGLSAAISAGAEILTEKLFGGSGLGEKGLINLDPLTKGISSKVVKALADFGIDMAAEGSEEVVSSIFSNLGSALYKEESIGELLLSEEAVDEYIESFIGGSVLGGAANVGNVSSSIKTGRDYRTGLTTDEQAVVDAIADERIAEKENGGEKLTNKQKNEIRQQVERDMERGYISVDDIERILGGETYVDYANTVAEQKALQDEYDKLYKMKNGEKSDEQIDRQAELKAKLEEIKQNGHATTLKSQLSDNVFNLAKDSRLAESYNERARRGQAFEADLSQYEGAQQETIKRAKESGILNNTNRTHEFVDMVAKISADKGVLFDFTNNAKLKESGFAVEGATVNGYMDAKSGTIGVNIDSAKAYDTIVGHEVTHVLEGTELYGELQKAVFEYAKTKGEYDSRREALAKLYAEGDIDSEMTADLVGEYLFTDENFVKNLSVQNRNVFQKIYDEIKYLLKVATAGSKEAREIERVKRAFDKAYREQGAKADVKGGVKHSLSAEVKKADADYLAAVERGDTETAQRMVDDAANKAMPNTILREGNAISKGEEEDGTLIKMFHGSGAKNFYTFEMHDGMLGKGVYLTSNWDEAVNYAMEKLGIEVSDDGYSYVWNGEEFDSIGAIGEALESEGYVRAFYANVTDSADVATSSVYWEDVIALVRDKSQLKSADPVTYDDNGNVIPLSERFKSENNDIRYSLSDSDGKQLSKGQQEYFKDSKMRDENGNLKVMYHGSQYAGFHVFDPAHSDDDTSLFFVDRNDVAASYSGTSETYEAQTIRTAEDMNKFIESIGVEGYEVVEKDGKFTLLYEGDRVAASDSAKGIYKEFCWYEGVGEGDANYKVYLNLTNPLEIDAKGRPWNKIDAEFSQEVYDKYQSLTAEEKDALTDLAEWEDFRIFNSEIQEAQGNALASAYAKMGEDCNIYDLFSVAADNFSEESMRENARQYLKTRDYAQRAKEQGYDGVIFKNIIDNGGYSNGSEGASTVAIAFDSNQVKSVANENPTGDPDIRYSLTEYTAEEKKAHNDAVLDHFGRTFKWNETGYLLLNGERLDLSGKHDGAPGGYRTVDHRDITDALGYDYGGGEYSGSLIQFMSEGNIRIVPEIGGINLSVKPTKAQEQALSDYISRNRGEVVLDIDDLNGNTVVSVEYPRGTYYKKVLDDIREWFDSGKQPTSDSDIRYSLSRNNELMDNAERYNSENLGINLDTAREQRQVIYDFMTKNADRLKLPADIEGNTAIKNSSYDITEENTTVCIRSMAADALCDAVAEELGRPLTVQDTLRISQDLMNYTDEPECVYCYVATDRRAYREFLGSYYKQMQSAIEALQSGKNKDDVYTAFLNGRKDTKNMRNRFAMWERVANGGKMISAKDLASEMMMQNAMKDPDLSAQVKDARAYAQSASWAKKRQGYQAYNGHILAWSKNRIRDLNKHYGLRFYSFSDFSPAFVLENMQQMTDAAARGLKGLAYTKVLDFAEIFAPTGININISVFGYNQNGTVAQDGMMGADWKGAQEIRNKYENVGITFVATNDAQIEWALDQEWIDVVIPYHLVRTGQAVAKHFGYTNYTAESSDTKGANWKKGDKKTIYPAEHNNDKQTYLAAIAEANLEPRFARWVNHPNYMKLVNETRRSANDTPPMQAVFNVDAAKASLERMMQRGGYFVPIGGDYANMQDIASEIADSIRADTSYSLSAEGEEPGKGRFFGKDIRLDIAPVAEDTSNTTDTEQVAPEPVAPVAHETVADAPTLFDLYDEQAYLQEQLLATKDEKTAMSLAQRYHDVTAQIKQFEAEEQAIQNERLASLGDADIPPEVEAPYYESDSAVLNDPFEKRDIKDVGDRKVKAYMYENPEVKPFFQQEANVMLGELRDTTKGEKWYNDQLYYESGGEHGWGGTSRQTTDDIAYLLDELGYSYAEIEKGLNAIVEDNGAENNACSKRIEFILNDRLMKGYDTFGAHVPANQDYINLINEKSIIEYSEEARKQFFEVADQYAPPAEDIAPIAKAAEKVEPIKSEPSMKRATEESKTEGKIAKVLTEEPQTGKKSKNAWSMFKNHVLDRGMVFEDLSLKTGNRELQARWNTIRYAESKAQKLIGEGNNMVSSLQSIRQTVENSGKTEEFYNYLYHKHNVDRMSLEAKAAPTIGALKAKFGHLTEAQVKAIAAKEITDTTTEKTAQTIREAKEYLNAIEAKNKPVFGDDVTADVSKERVAEYEKANPEFKEWAQDVYGYMNYLREMLVDDGVISYDTARLWAEMYPNYVPIRRAGKDGLSITVPLDTGRTGINAPVKGATGGNSDILPLFDTMALRTEQTYRAIAKNRFGVELKNTLGTTIDSKAQGVDDTIESIDNHDELLKEGKNGASPTFTVFENGERVEFEITEEMYDAMKPTSKELAYTNKALNTAGNVFRGLLTEYNPVFMTTNAAKDVQDILINSQHPTRTYAAIPKAITQMAKGGHWYKEYLANGGEQNTYFDGESKTFKAEDNGWKKVVGMPLRGISYLNNAIERIPRLAEYIASREAGQSIDVSMLDAARVTTNFAAGGDLTKALNRNGFTFLNASTQGAVQQVRNIREAKANGLKGWVQLATKVAAAGLPVILLNSLLWDDDEEYEELSDYVKQNYYVVAKFGDGQFVRIPKGRTVAVIQDALEQVSNALTGDDEVDLQSFLELAISNLAPNNPLENNILAPIIQVKNNETWYGEDLVPTRLQDLPAAEQYDESTDSLSRWLGEKTNTSPYKWNYLLNQYSGGVGDVVLPMMTPEAESGDNSFVGNVVAPFKDKFTTDSTMKNQNVSDFYDTVDELTKNAKSSNATDEDVLKYKYMNSVNAELSELYKQKREIQNSDLPDAEKYDAVRDVQKQINSLASESLETYGDVYINDGYATVGDRHYKLKDGEWQKISDEQLEKQNEVVDGLGIDPSEYWANKSEYDFAYEYPERYAVAKSVGGYEQYKTYSSELYDIKADKDEDGKSITGSRKEKVIDYINNLDADYGEKIILFKSEYKADDTYNEEIIDYLNNREDISYDEMVTILTELGFTVKNGHVYWD